MSLVQSFDYFKRIEFAIAAPATAMGGPLVVIRVSGKNLDFLARELAISAQEERVANYRNIFGLDQGLVLFFKSPKSFTGEDVIEFQVHGSDRICESLMSELKSRNVLEALPGEFSFRAFMNQKMTLAEAEALHVALSAASATPAASELASLSKNAQANTQEIFTAVERDLVSARGRLESAIDFSEAVQEQDADVASCFEKLSSLRQTLEKFLTAYENFSYSWSIPKVLIVGEPNSGKSSLMNLLLGNERSIVSDRPGTTRDYIEARVKISNQTLIFVDTAGLRGLEGEKIDDLERRGIDRALSLISEAHAIIWTQPSNKEKNKNIEKLVANHPTVVSVESFGDISKKSGAINLQSDATKLRHLLEKELLPKIFLRSDSEKKNVEYFLSERQVRLFREVDSHVNKSLKALAEHKSLELVAEDLRLADQALKKCLGRELSDDYISEIFSQFCLGK